MEAAVSTTPRPPAPDAQAEPDADDRREAAVEAYARDHDGLTEGNERDALDYILGPKPPREYDVKVEVETDAGPRPMTFVIRAMDGRKIDSIEQTHVSQATGVIDRFGADSEIVAEALVMLESPRRKVDPRSAEFLTMKVRNRDTDEEEDFVHASPAEALLARYRTQLGLLAGVAREVRRVSGFDAGKVSEAKRRLIAASGN